MWNLHPTRRRSDLIDMNVTDFYDQVIEMMERMPDIREAGRSIAANKKIGTAPSEEARIKPPSVSFHTSDCSGNPFVVRPTRRLEPDGA